MLPVNHPHLITKMIYQLLKQLQNHSKTNFMLWEHFVCILILFSTMFALECEVRVAEILSEMLQDKVIISGKSRHTLVITSQI